MLHKPVSAQNNFLGNHTIPQVPLVLFFIHFGSWCPAAASYTLMMHKPSLEGAHIQLLLRLLIFHYTLKEVHIRTSQLLLTREQPVNSGVFYHPSDTVLLPEQRDADVEGKRLIGRGGGSEKIGG